MYKSKPVRALAHGVCVWVCVGVCVCVWVGGGGGGGGKASDRRGKQACAVLRASSRQCRGLESPGVPVLLAQHRSCV